MISRFTWIAYGVLLALGIVLLGAIVHPIWQPLLLAAIIAATLSPLEQKITSRMPPRWHKARAFSTVIVLLLVVLLLFLPLAILGTIAVQQTVQFFAFAKTALAQGGLHGLTAKLPDRFEHWAEMLLKYVPTDLRTVVDKVGGTQLTDWATAFASAVSETLFQITVVLIALYFFLLDGPRLVLWIVHRSPIGRERTWRLMRETRRSARAVLGSTVLTAGAQAISACIGYLIAGVPQPLFWTLLTFMCAFLPSVGTAVVIIPLCLFLWLGGHTVAAIFLAAYAVLIIGLVDNLLKPLLIKDGIELHGALVFFSLLGGVITFGPIGILLGPLVLTFFLSMVRLGAILNEASPAPSEPPANEAAK